MILRTLLTTAALCGLCETVQAAPETHDGFFLQFNIGPSGQSWVIEDPTPVFDELSVEGSGVQFDVSIGGSVTPNLVIFGQITANSVVSPELSGRIGGVSMSDNSGSDVAASTVGVGGGVAYYLLNGLYFAGSALSLQLQLDEDRNDDGERAESDSGLGFQLRVGKEWWVSDEWGLGIAGSYLRGNVPAKNTDSEWAVNNYAITFTATFN